MIFRDEFRLEQFVIWMNGIDINITFTQQSTKEMILFLDTYVFRSENDLVAIKPFRKPTDMSTYLHYELFHPVHIHRNLPYGQFLRLRRNSTQDSDFIRASQVLYNQLLQRGYPERIVKQAYTRVQCISRSNILKDVTISIKRKDWYGC